METSSKILALKILAKDSYRKLRLLSTLGYLAHTLYPAHNLLLIITAN